MIIGSFVIADHAKVRDLSLFMFTTNVLGFFELILFNTTMFNWWNGTEWKKGRMNRSKTASREIDLNWKGKPLLILSADSMTCQNQQLTCYTIRFYQMKRYLSRN